MTATTAYLTSAEFTAQIIPAGAVAGIDPTSSLIWASRQADLYIGKRYALPLVSWQEDLKLIVGMLAQYHLFAFRGYRPGSGNEEVAKERYDTAMGMLKDISNGTAVLSGVVDATATVDEEGPVAASESKQNFRRVSGPVCDPETLL